MQCIKCGRDVEDKQVFCPECLASMDQAPVKPGTPVSIPKRPAREYTPPVKKDKPEEIILRLQKKLKVLSVTILVLVIALSISLGMITYHFVTTEHDGFDIGFNYSTEAADDFRGR